MLVVQGGPGTGKTVVALHRAAYLLYTHRFPLEDQGVLVIGPNRVFLRYIERVLPSLGEAGIEQVVLADLVPDVRFACAGDDGDDWPEAARLKGDARMSDVIDQAIGDRERPLRDDLVMPFRSGYVRLRAERIGTDRADGPAAVPPAQQRSRSSSSRSSGRPWRRVGVTTRSARGTVREVLRNTDEVRAALDRMWPVLTPAQLLHDLFGSKALLKSAGRGVLGEHEALLLFRERSENVGDRDEFAAPPAVREPATPVAFVPLVEVHVIALFRGHIPEEHDLRRFLRQRVDPVLTFMTGEALPRFGVA